MKYLLGIDVGTTGTKTVLFSECAEPKKRAYRSYPLYCERVGESEQEPGDFWRAIVETVREVSFGATPEDIVAISLSTQGGTLVPTDAKGNPTRRAIVWNDIRFTDEREKYLREIGEPDTLYRKTGWGLGRGMPLLALRYLRDKEPEVFARSELFLSVPSYVSMKMTGIAATDLSNGGIEQLLNIESECYDSELLAFAGVTPERLAVPIPSGKVIGHLTEEAARELGLTTNTVLVSGAHDQYAVALGAGATEPGDILIGSGTCWVVTALSKEPDFDSHLAQSRSAVGGLWGTLRSLSTGGVCLDWLRKNIATKDGTEIDYTVINEAVRDRRAAEDGLFFFPFKGMRGDGESFTKATFLGLDLSHDRFSMARAVMEGFAVKPGEDGIKLGGGASKSRVWAEILADASGLPVRIPELADLSTVGAAILAGVGVGIFRDVRDGYSRFTLKEHTVMPNKERHEIYRPLYEKYKRLARELGRVYDAASDN